MTFRSPAESPTPMPSRANGPLLDALQKHVLDRAVPALDRALANLDDYLFDRSQSGEESLGLMALRDMRRARSEITRQFRQAVLNRFRGLRDGNAVGVGDDTGLSLLSDQDLEEQLAIEQLAASVLRSHASTFEVVGKRFSAVSGRGELQPRENPLDPVFLAGALGQAMDKLDMEADLRIVVFKFFERELTGVLGEIYERCNSLMAAAGILPELRTSGGMPQRASRSAPSAAQAPHAHTAAGGHYGPSTDYESSAAATPLSGADQAQFANMLGMLQGWRSAMGLASPAGQAASGPVLPTQDLMSILSLMQHDGSARFTPAAEAEQSLAGQLRQQMTQSARKLGVRGDNLNLDGLDGDAVDLVALLFDVLLDGAQYDTHIRQKIGRMLVPYVKVAVKDRRMFMFKEHPARKLLNTVAEACEGNRGEAPQERELLTRVDHTIDRLVAEFNEDVAIFETLEQELRALHGTAPQTLRAGRKTHRRSAARARTPGARAQGGGRGSGAAARRAGVAAGDRRIPGPAHQPPPDPGGAARWSWRAPLRGRAARGTIQLLAAFDQAAAGVAIASAALQPDDGLRAILASAGCTGRPRRRPWPHCAIALSRWLAGQAALVGRRTHAAAGGGGRADARAGAAAGGGGRFGKPRL